jgi:hypothetical protein
VTEGGRSSTAKGVRQAHMHEKVHWLFACEEDHPYITRPPWCLPPPSLLPCGISVVPWTATPRHITRGAAILSHM